MGRRSRIWSGGPTVLSRFRTVPAEPGCPLCGGMGWTWKSDSFTSRGSFGAVNWKEICPKCRGSGVGEPPVEAPAWMQQVLEVAGRE